MQERLEHLSQCHALAKYLVVLQDYRLATIDVLEAIEGREDALRHVRYRRRFLQASTQKSVGDRSLLQRHPAREAFALCDLVDAAVVSLVPLH